MTQKEGTIKSAYTNMPTLKILRNKILPELWTTPKSGVKKLLKMCIYWGLGREYSLDLCFCSAPPLHNIWTGTNK